MAIYIEELVNELYDNIQKQVDLGNRLLNYRKGTLVIKKRNNNQYYYLSYRSRDTIKTDYLGKLNQTELNRITSELKQGIKIKESIKRFQQEEKELRRLIKAIDRKALIKDVYELMDIIAIIRPILKEFGIKETYIYGDYANGNANEESSIDLVIDKTNKNVKELKKRISKDTNKYVNIVTPNTILRDIEIQTIDEEKLLIYGGY